MNATCFNDRPSGAKQRFAGIYGELVRRLPDVEFVLYEPRDCSVGNWFDAAPNLSARRTTLASDGRRVQRLRLGPGYWNSNLAQEGFDLVESFNLPPVKAPAGRTLLTIHDIRRLHPKWKVSERFIYKMVLPRALRAADHVITVSESMKKAILGFYPGIPISVIYNGLDAGAFHAVSEADLLEFRRRYQLPSEFALTVGHLESRKNYLRLVDAFALLRDRGRSCTLLIVGNDSGSKKAIKKRIGCANLNGAVRILTGLSDLEVRCAYKLCSLFIFPSSYEGFGIPILEAMAARRPMVLSDIPVFREITQDSGVYFCHRDIESMAFAIETVLSSSSERARLIEYGSARVQAFSFQSLAAQVERLYRSLV